MDGARASERLESTDFKRRLSVPSSGSLTRRIRERKLAEETRREGERLARERAEYRAREKIDSQRRAHHELATYEPWGRAGGGAPNARGIRFTNIRDRGIIPEDELRGVNSFEATRRWQPPPRRFRRNPRSLRLREDPEVCYADNLRKSVDNDIRYRQTPRQQRQYKDALDDMVLQRQLALHDEMRRNLDHERKMHAADVPWGKPGPGGTSWRNPRDIGLNFSESMGWTNNNMLNKMKTDGQKNSLRTLPKVKYDLRDQDYVDKMLEKENTEPQKLPGINKSNSATARKEDKPGENVTQEYNIGEIDVRQNKNSLDPIRRETNSSANRQLAQVYQTKQRRSPKKSHFDFRKLPNGEDIRCIVPDDYYNNCPNMEDVTNYKEKKPTPEAAILSVTGGVELVPLLARRRRVGARTLPSSDVTRPPEDSCQWREMLDSEHLRILKHQMEVKCLQNEGDKLKQKRLNSAEEIRQHHATWASLWGRPGHGAPQQRGRYARSNLAQLLYTNPLSNYSNVL